MANPLFNALMSGFKPSNGTPKQEPVQQPENAQNVPQGQPMTFQSALRQLQTHPAQLIRQAGYNVPEDIAGNPQAAVMHLIQSGQVGGPMMRMIQPMLNRLIGR